METHKVRAMTTFGSIAIVILAISQLSSYLVNTRIPIGETYEVNSLVFLTHTRNLGGIFGSFQGAGWLFALISFALLFGLIVYLWRSKSAKFYEYVCLGCITGAGLSNILDRFVYGGVIDFINIQQIPNWHYIFNTADVMIHVGLWPMIILSLLAGKHENDQLIDA